MHWKLLTPLLFISSVIAGNDAHDAIAHRVPDPLTISNFDDTLNQGFHIVEFFSPYCPHCTHLFPTWVEFYEQSVANHANYKVHQVDCVASGDLCDRENIRYYPLIRFYGPQSKMLGSMQESAKDINSINTFVEDQLMLWSDNLDVEPLDLSTQIDKDTFMETVITGQFQNPKLISFWPTTDNELSNSNFNTAFTDNDAFTKSPVYFTFQNAWNLVLKNTIAKIGQPNNIDFHFFNCNSNKEICNQLGFQNLIMPRVVLYLPGKQSNNAIIYNHNIQNTSPIPSIKSLANSLAQWTYTNLINFELQDMKFREIANFIGAKTKLGFQDELSDLQDYSPIAFVLVNDPQTQVPEDSQILPYLLQDIADLDANAYLFKTSDLQAVERFLLDQEKFLLDKYIHYHTEDEDDNADIVFDEQAFLSRTRSSYPMLIAIKSQSVYTQVYRSFQTKDIRDADLLLEFIESNADQVTTHLTPDTARQLFPEILDPQAHDASEKVVVSITDFASKQLFQTIFHNSQVYHNHIVHQNRIKHEFIEQKRSAKHKQVKKLRDKDASSDDIIMKLREEIDADYKTNKFGVTTAYTDISNLKNVANKLGWSNLDIDSLQVGDVLVIDRFKNNYYRTSSTVDDPNTTVKFLANMFTKGKLPHPLTLAHTSFLVRIVQVWSVIVVSFIAYQLYTKWRNHKSKSNRFGLLGVPGESKSE